MKRDIRVVIPTRLDSTRLPNKPLLEAGNKTLLEWTYERACSGFDKVTILTSDTEISDFCRKKGMDSFFTSKLFPTGTHRIADYATTSRLAKEDWFVDWQVDEPLLDVSYVEEIAENCESDEINTLVAPISEEQRQDPNIVKAAWSTRGDCYWFSRSPLSGSFGHIGVYAFSRTALRFFYATKKQQSYYAFHEKLEQLNWIEMSTQFYISANFVPEFPLSINSEEDWDAFKKRIDGQANRHLPENANSKL